MSKLTKLTSAVAAAGVGLAMMATPILAQANEVHIKVQAVLGTQTTEVKMLRDFMDDVTALTGGDVTFEVLPDACAGDLCDDLRGRGPQGLHRPDRLGL